jgi:hypothetical protein
MLYEVIWKWLFILSAEKMNGKALIFEKCKNVKNLQQITMKEQHQSSKLLANDSEPKSRNSTFWVTLRKKSQKII